MKYDILTVDDLVVNSLKEYALAHNLIGAQYSAHESIRHRKKSQKFDMEFNGLNNLLCELGILTVMKESYFFRGGFNIIDAEVVRYKPGDYYGPHYDAHILNGKICSTSFSLILQAPEAGGRLYIDDRFYELNQGEIIVYPADKLHHVEPVKTGERIALIGWIENHIESLEQRELIHRYNKVMLQLTDEFKINEDPYFEGIWNELLYIQSRLYRK